MRNQPTKQTQLQSKGRAAKLHINMDQPTMDSLKSAHRLTQNFLNVKVSHAVLIRRAVRMYREMIQQAINVPDDEILEAVEELAVQERMGLLHAAEGI